MAHRLKKKHSQDPARVAKLKQATDLLFAGECNNARLILEAAATRDQKWFQYQHAAPASELP